MGKQLQQQKLSAKVIWIMVAVAVVINLVICGIILWRANTVFSISFYDDRGQSMGVTIEGYAGSDISQYTSNISTTKPGYDFENWYSNAQYKGAAYILPSRMPAGNVTLYGKWNPRSYTLTFDFQKTGASTMSYSIKYNQSIKSADRVIPSVSQDGKVLVEWNTKKDGTGSKFTDETLIKGNTIIYAIWHDDFCNINLNYQDTGYQAGLYTVDYGTSLNMNSYSLPTPVATHKQFMGWNTRPDGSGETITNDTMFVKHQTIYAIWKFDEMTVNLHYQNSNYEDVSYTVPYSKCFANTTNRLKYYSTALQEIVKWNTKADGSGVDYNNNTPIKDNIDLYAIWQTKTIMIHLEYNINEPIHQEVLYFDIEINSSLKANEYTLPIPTSINYRFIGWYDNPQGEGDKITEDTVFTYSTIIYAVWEPIQN